MLLTLILVLLIISVVIFIVLNITKKSSGNNTPHNTPHDTAKMSLIPTDTSKLNYLFWHVNNAMGIDLASFPWDPLFKMKNKIEYFIVGIWPTWTKDDYTHIISKYGNKYENCLAEEQLATANIEKTVNLILLCQEYAKQVGAQFVPFLLPAINGWSSKIQTAQDILLGIDGQLLIMEEIYHCPCQGVLLEGEEHYMDITINNEKNSLMADKIFASLRATWTSSVNTQYKYTTKDNKNTKDIYIAWSEQGPMKSIRCFSTKDTPWDSDISKSITKTINGAEFTWPDSYEGNWSGGFGHWKPPGLLSSCNSDKNPDGCPPLQTMYDNYSMVKETNTSSCCAGWAKGYGNSDIGRYCVPANKFAQLTKDQLIMTDKLQTIFAAGGPGADLGVKFSGLGSGNSALGVGSPCSGSDTNILENNTVLSDLFDGFNEIYLDDKWGLKYGKSLALYG